MKPHLKRTNSLALLDAHDRVAQSTILNSLRRLRGQPCRSHRTFRRYTNLYRTSQPAKVESFFCGLTEIFRCCCGIALALLLIAWSHQVVAARTLIDTTQYNAGQTDASIRISVERGLASLYTRRANIRNILTRVSDAYDVSIALIDLGTTSLPDVTLELTDQSLLELLQSILARLPSRGFVILGVGENTVSDTIRIYLLERYQITALTPVAQRDVDNLQKTESTPPGPFAYTSPSTERDLLWLRNHEALLRMRAQIRNYHETLAAGDDPHVPDLRTWADTLFQDAILAQLLGADPADSRRPDYYEILEQVPDPPPIELLQSPVPSTRRDYGKTLRTLLNSVYTKGPGDWTSAQMRSLITRFNDLLVRRKRYSDNYYRTAMWSYLWDESVTVREKIAYMESFIDRDDHSLISYGQDFFTEFVEQKTLEPEDLRAIDTFQVRAREAIDR